MTERVDISHLPPVEQLRRIRKGLRAVIAGLPRRSWHTKAILVRFSELLERVDASVADVIETIERPSRPASDERPEDGHTWRFTAECRGSSCVVGEPYSDHPEWDQPVTFEVRAWSLSAALEKASRLPFPILVADLERELEDDQ